MSYINYSWDLVSSKGHRVLGRLILLKVSHRGLIVFQIGLWTWRLLSRGSRAEHTATHLHPERVEEPGSVGNFKRPFRANFTLLRQIVFSHLLELPQALQASPGQFSLRNLSSLVWPFLNAQAAAKNTKVVQCISGKRSSSFLKFSSLVWRILSISLNRINQSIRHLVMKLTAMPVGI